jgi:hypothetical protein
MDQQIAALTDRITEIEASAARALAVVGDIRAQRDAAIAATASAPVVDTTSAQIEALTARLAAVVAVLNNA